MKNPIPVKKKNRTELILLGILLLGLTLRLQQWGRFLVADEDTIFGWLRHMAGAPFPIHHYPPFFQYINYALSLVYGPLLSFIGVISHSAELWASETGRLIVMSVGRLLSVFFGMMQIYWVYRIGKRFFTARVGLLASLLIAFNPLLIFDNHILKVDSLLAFLFTLQLYLILLYWEQKGHRTLWGLGMVTGLAIAAKFQAAVEIPVLVLLVILAGWRLGVWNCLRSLLILAGWVLVGFFIGAPNWLIHLAGNIRAAFAYVNELYFSFELYDKSVVAFPLYFRDFIASFGPVVMLGVLGAFLSLLFRFRWKDFWIWLSVASFLGILGFSSFYAHRMGLPLYSALSILGAKFFCEDVMQRLENWISDRRWARLPLLLLLAGALGYAAVNGTESIQRFNLRRTASSLGRAIEFREHHFAPGTVFIRENFSPVRPGDKGIWDLIGVESDLFRGTKAMPFLSTGLLADYLLEGHGDRQRQFELRHRLEEYVPFHRIRKRPFSDWEGDVTFWYHTPLAKLKSEIAGKNPALPRAFVLQTARDAVAYPLGRYEKLPGLLKTGPQSDWHPEWRMIYSLEEIRAFRGLIFSSDAPKKIVVEVNGCQKTIPGAIGVVPFEISSFQAQPLHHDWVYRMTVNAGQNEVWTLFEPVYRNDELNRCDRLVSFSEIPDVRGEVSNEEYSEQEVSFYKRSGIDLRLYSLLQRVYLEVSGETQRVFLKRGRYRLRLSVSDAARDCPGPVLRGSVVFRSLGAVKEESWLLSSPDQTLDFELEDEYALSEWRLDPASAGSLKAWIEPDPAAFLNQKTIRR